MTRNGKSLTRRHFLSGTGVTICLPLLDAIAPALAASRQTSAGTTRLGFVYTPNGMVQQGWLPSQTGAGFLFGQSMKPLEPYRKKMLVLSNLMQDNGNPIGDGAGQHSRASSTWLTGVAPKRTEGPDVEAGVSADQLAAAELGKHTRLRSLELGLERLEPASDSGYNSIYANTISWRTATSPNPMNTTPRAVFEQLFSDKQSKMPLDLQRPGTSILDTVLSDSARLRSSLSPSDKVRLDEHLARIRDVELRTQKTGKSQTMESYEDRAELMTDLMVFAFQTDMTRVASLMLAREGSDLAYSSLGMSEGHHTLSHHGNDAEKIASTMKINELHVRLFSQLVQKMDATPDGDGTLLDHSMLLFGSSLSDGNLHTHRDLPLVLVGGSRCGIQGGRHIRYAPETPMNNLLLTMLNKAGVRVNTIGDSTGQLDLNAA